MTGRPFAAGVRVLGGSALTGFLSESATTGAAVLDAGAVVRECNGAFAWLLGVEADAMRGRSLTDWMWEGEHARLRARLADAEGAEAGAPFPMTFLDASLVPVSLQCRLWAGLEEGPGDRARVVLLVVEGTREVAALSGRLLEVMRELALVERESARRGAELARALEDLRTSHWHLRRIHEVLPLCLDCGRVKGEDATWQSVVDFLREHAAFLSHGYCPACAARFLAEAGLSDEDATSDGAAPTAPP